MQTVRTIAFTLALALALAPLAAAQDTSLRSYSGAIGSVSMPRDTTGTTVVATVVVNGAAATAAGAAWILVSIGNDAATSLAVTGVTADGPVASEKTEGEGLNRVNVWFDAAGMPDSATFNVSATVDVGGVPTDVEVVLQAFDASYTTLNGADGAPLSVQSWTGVAASGAPDDSTTDNSTSTPGNDSVPSTDDGTMGGGLDDDGAIGDDVGDNEEESTDRGIPTLGLVSFTGAVLAVAVAMRRR